jgi:uncharacterized membrane protein YcaP (DUF421 family)
MFTPSIGYAELVFRAIVVYFALFALLRFAGKKHVGELSPFDLVVLLVISETVDASLIADDKSLTGGLVSAATIVVTVQIIGYFTWRFRPAERFIEGVPRILVRHGEVDDAVLDAERITRAELMEALRQQGHSSLEQVRFAVLENDGSISFGMRPKSNEN